MVLTDRDPEDQAPLQLVDEDVQLHAHLLRCEPA